MVAPEGTYSYEHDAAGRNRLLAGQADLVETLSSNALGALGSHAGSSVSTARPRLTGGGTAPSAIPASIDGRDVTIDGLGQVVGIGPETLSWTRSGQLTGIVRAADEERYSYDAYQRRIARARGPVGGPFASVYYTYEGPNIAQEVTISPNALLRSWIYDGVDHPLRMRDSRPGAATPLAYYELDLAGNIRRLRAPGGADLGGYRYAAFGKQLAADATTPTPTVDQPMRWKGRWWSEFGGTAGTYDMRARIWAPELGVFLSIDEFAYHDARGTLWSWPNQSPVRFGDAAGRGELTFIACVLASSAGAGSIGACVKSELSQIKYSLGEVLGPPGDNCGSGACPCAGRNHAGGRGRREPTSGTESRGGGASSTKDVKVGGEPWRAMEPGTPACQTGCDDVAEAIKEAVGGEIAYVKPPREGMFLGGVRNSAGKFVNPAGSSAPGWSSHTVVVKDGIVYDALTGPSGMPASAYKQLWQYADAIRFGF